MKHPASVANPATIENSLAKASTYLQTHAPEASGTLALAQALRVYGQSPALETDHLAQLLSERTLIALKQSALFEAFVGLASLYDYRQDMVHGEHFAAAAQVLIATETQSGGPYVTANFTEQSIQANAAIAYFMELLDTPLPNVSRYLRQALNHRHSNLQISGAGYYHLAHVVMSGADNDESSASTTTAQLSQLRARTEQRLQKLLGATSISADHHDTDDGTLELAYLLAAWRVCSQDTQPVQYIPAILERQQSDGSWTQHTGAAISAPTLHTSLSTSAINAKVLTTALIVEALRPSADSTSSSASWLIRAHKNIIADCTRLATTAPAELRQPLSEALQRIQATDTNHEISLLPSFFAASVRTSSPDTSNPLNASEQLCQTLGVANVYCWVAYTIYDNILDDEPHAALQLPVANLAVRYAYEQYLHASSDNTSNTGLHQDMLQLVNRTYSNMDAANAWELRHCRSAIKAGMITIGALPHYGKRTILAQRAFAHVLGPLLLLQRNDYVIDSTQFTSIEQGLQHFLIARQLQDDLHDWVEDLRAGQLSYIVTDLLRQLRIRSGTYAIEELIGQMKQMFWERGLTRHCNIITQHTQAARQAFQRSGSITTDHPTPLLALIDRLERAALQAQQNYTRSQDFIRHYR